jgi:acyl phosphate:glycerol-3-phosphate acyltransferase
MVGGLILLLAFVAGTLPTGPLLARLRGVDLRAVGSGNVGATNAARALGKPLGLLVLLLDAGKGAAAILLARALGADPWIVAGAGLLAVIGHVANPWLRFRGGKGVATALGVFAVLLPVGALVALCVFAAVYAATRLVSLGSLLGAVALVIVAYRIAPPPTRLAAIAVAALIVLRHRDNIGRMRRGEEKRL